MSAADQHPAWCEQGPTCTFPMRERGHVSAPEVFKTPVGRVVATRYGDDSGGHLELRIVLPLPSARPADLEWFMRAATALTHRSVARVLYALRGRRATHADR